MGFREREILTETHRKKKVMLRESVHMWWEEVTLSQAKEN